MSGIILTLLAGSGTIPLVADASFSGAPLGDLGFGG